MFVSDSKTLSTVTQEAGGGGAGTVWYRGSLVGRQAGAQWTIVVEVAAIGL